LDWRRAGEIGCTLASFAIGAVGTQEHAVTAAEFRARTARAYGPEAAAAVHLLFTPQRS
jgi:hypothetical protein